jgi:hypothetical protein
MGMKLLNGLLIILLFPGLAIAMEQDQPVKKAEEEKKVYQPKLLFEQNLKVVTDQLLNLIKQQGIIDSIVDSIGEEKEEIEEGGNIAELKQETIQYIEPLFEQLRELAQTSADKKIIEAIIAQIQQYHAGNLVKEAITYQRGYAIAQLLKLPAYLKLIVLETILQKLPKYEIWVDPEHTLHVSDNPQIPFAQKPPTIEGAAVADLFDELFAKITEAAKNKEITARYTDEQRKELADLMFKYDVWNSHIPLLARIASIYGYEIEPDPAMAEKKLEKLRILIKYSPAQAKFDALYFLAFKLATGFVDHEQDYAYIDQINEQLAAFELLLKAGINSLVSNQNNKSFGTLLHEWKELGQLPIQYQGQTFNYPLSQKLIDRMLEIMEKVKDEKEEEL